MAFRKRNTYVALDDLGVVLIRVAGNVSLLERFERWEKLILESPVRLNFAVITDLSDWSGVISEDNIYSIVAWGDQVRAEHNVPPVDVRKLAWIGRAGACLDQMISIVNRIPGDRGYHATTAQEAWQMVKPGVPMPAMVKKFFKKRTLF